MAGLRLQLLTLALLIAAQAPSIALAKQETAPAGSPPPLTEAERNVGLPGVPFSDVIEAKGTSTIADGAVQENGTLLTIPYSYRYTAVITEDVKGFSFTVAGIQAPTGSPGYYAGSFVSSGDYISRTPNVPMDLWCFFPQAAGGKRENICLLRNNPKLAAIAPTRMNPYLWDHFSPMTGTFDYVKTPIFKREVVDLPIKPSLEYRFSKWRDGVAQIQLYAMGRFVTDLSVSKDENAEYRLRTIGGDYLILADDVDKRSVRLIRNASAPVMSSRFVRMRLTVDANSHATSCTVLESDAPLQLQEKTCQVIQDKAKFSVSSTTLEQTVRFQLPSDEWPKTTAPSAAGADSREQPIQARSP